MVTRPARTDRRSFRRAPVRAFTLVEMMVALLVAALVAVMVMGVVRTTVAVVGDNTVDEQRGTMHDRVRALFSAQFAWLDESGDVERKPPIIGGPDWLEVSTLVSVRAPHRREPALMRLRALPDPGAEGGWRLLYSEQTQHDVVGRVLSRRADPEEPPAPGAEDAGATDPETARRQFEEAMRGLKMRTILSGCAWIEIAYLERVAGGQLSWEKNWVGRVGAPRAVRIMWSTMNGEVREWVMPVVATY